MKTFVTIVRWLVGLLFIFSGLIKANDPLGLSYKMLEFFEAWGWHFFDNYALGLSIVMNVCEVLAGIAVIIGWRIKWVSWFLLLLIVFFTFLTGYVLFSNKIKECGCFGDCVPLSGINTFLKDVVLLLLILLIFFQTRQVRSFFDTKISFSILGVTLLVTVVVQLYVLKYLPFLDCLPYKKGNHILNEMKVPAGAVQDSSVITFRYKKDGKEIEFDQSHFPADFDSTYEYLDRYDKLVRKGNAQPAIIDFALRTLDGADTTQGILGQDNRYLLVFAKDFNNVSDWQGRFNEILKTSLQKNIAVYLVTADAGKATSLFRNVMILKCDATVIKTAARVNPTYFFMKRDLIVDKLSYADQKKIEYRIKNSTLQEF
jgi:uncharacterized membrane protein YphA (DoxX/SURF4 family)